MILYCCLIVDPHTLFLMITGYSYKAQRNKNRSSFPKHPQKNCIKKVQKLIRRNIQSFFLLAVRTYYCSQRINLHCAQDRVASLVWAVSWNCLSSPHPLWELYIVQYIYSVWQQDLSPLYLRAWCNTTLSPPLAECWISTVVEEGWRSGQLRRRPMGSRRAPAPPRKPRRIPSAASCSSAAAPTGRRCV